MSQSTVGIRLVSLVILFCMSGAISESVAVVPVDDFAAIPGGVFHDILVPMSGDSLVSSANFGGVTITGTPESNVGVYSIFPVTSTPNDPGDGRGYNLWSRAPIVTLNFDVPVAAFGVSFTHVEQFLNADFFSPARLSIYDEPNGAGNLLGVIDSSGTTNPGPKLIDFVGFSSDVRNIRSAKIERTVLDTDLARYVGVDGYGLSLTPIPEPTTLFLSTVALFAMGWRRRREVQSRS